MKKRMLVLFAMVMVFSWVSLSIVASWRLVFHQTLKEIATIKMRLVAIISLRKREVRLSIEDI